MKFDELEIRDDIRSAEECLTSQGRLAWCAIAYVKMMFNKMER